MVAILEMMHKERNRKMNETGATIEILNKIAVKEASGWLVSDGSHTYTIELNNDGTFAFWERWRAHVAKCVGGFELLEELSKLVPKFAAKLAEPMK